MPENYGFTLNSTVDDFLFPGLYYSMLSAKQFFPHGDMNLYNVFAKRKHFVNFPVIFIVTRSAISGPASPGGAGSPRMLSKPGSSPPVNLSDERLLAKLTDVAIVRDAADRRRKHFQQRKQDEWRTWTQPVTGAEVQAADK